MELGDALAWLDRHQNLERMLADARRDPPDPARMRRLVDVLGHPESAAPALHLTGTNGKTSTSRALARLLMAKGLSVGAFTSPHLERVNERIAANGEPIADDELARALSDLAGVEPLVGGDSPLTWFEVLTGAALSWFADRPVDASVIEVGLGGRWDATNVVRASVAVVTNIGSDHAEFLGPTRRHIAGEKAGIIKEGTTLVLGEEDPDLLPIFEGEHPEQLWLAGRDWEVRRNQLAVGGRSLDLRTPGAAYDGVWLALHGRHQAANFAAAVVAAEAFFAEPLPPDLVREVASTMRSPGRMEVVGRRPLVILDGAKNLEGAASAAATLLEEFGESRSRILVVGMLGGKDPAEMLRALDVGRARLVVACPPAAPRAQPPEAIAAAAREAGVATVLADSVPEAVETALAAAGVDDLVFVTGSLYVVGEARATLGVKPG
ncbi:MAG: bifunctional folylpolyglutamate synthase/dihydrofolate synthase [Acidimicrobiales bacterium]